ncbi:transposase family protein [Streptomyces cupreus]|uniref:transposase family protein n=1 Tax=Streptomyces cupreus TaxID=2759956 RepID=UPI003AB99CC7
MPTGCPLRGLSGWPTEGRRVHLVTTDETARACPTCGVFATRVKGSAVTCPRDLPYGESGLEFRWHKRRWFCREAGCPRRSFTEQIAQIPAGARLTARLRRYRPGQADRPAAQCGRAPHTRCRRHGHPGRPGPAPVLSDRDERLPHPGP